ncbi:MAG: hypothetical protein ABSH26_00005, partial [Opitutaceae bacterium]
MWKRLIWFFAIELVLWVVAARGENAPQSPPPPLPEGDKGVAARYPADRGIEADPAVLFHDDFETDDLRVKWDNSFQKADIRIAEEPANVHGGRRA